MRKTQLQGLSGTSEVPRHASFEFKDVVVDGERGFSEKAGYLAMRFYASRIRSDLIHTGTGPKNEVTGFCDAILFARSVAPHFSMVIKKTGMFI